MVMRFYEFRTARPRPTVGPSTARKFPPKNGYKKRAEKPAFLDRLNPLYSSPERNRLVEATEFTKLI